jgi:hypothetical protein
MNRINRLFEGPTKERLLNIIQLFVNGEYKACREAINNLPYNSDDHCSEQEFVTPFISDFLWDTVYDNAIAGIDRLPDDPKQVDSGDW